MLMLYLLPGQRLHPADHYIWRIMRNLFTIMVIAFATGVAGVDLTRSALSPLPAVRNGFVVIAHRGNHLKVPENTVASIEEAIRSGADYVEMDLRTTKDGRLVLSHDASVDRMTNGKGMVKELTYAQMAELKVGPDTGGTYRIATFEAALTACKGRINIYLDFKEADPEITYRQIRAAGMEKQIVVYLNKEEQYSQWKKAAPSMPLMGSIPKEISTPEQFRSFLDKIQLEVLDNVYDTALQAITTRHGTAIWLDVEGSNEAPAIWDRALAMNIQGVQTDHPDALIAYLRQTGRRNGRAGDPAHKDMLQK